MQKEYDLVNRITQIGKRLVAAFEEAKEGTHPHVVSGAKENAARKLLEGLLPDGIGVGSGFVFDSQKRVSKQCDIIIYEKSTALKVPFSEDVSNAYYNCESVIAVGEIKSVASTKEIKDTLQKFEELGTLRRRISDPLIWRKYLSATSERGKETDKYDEINNGSDQIYKFLICDRFSTNLSSISKQIKSICTRKGNICNLLISLDGTSYAGTQLIDDCKRIRLSPTAADCFTKFHCRDKSFLLLIVQLYAHIQTGRTVPINIVDYVGHIEVDFLTMLDDTPLRLKKVDHCVHILIGLNKASEDTQTERTEGEP